MPGRGSSCLLLALIAFGSIAAVAGETRTVTPPPDTQVIPWTRFSVQYAKRVVGTGQVKVLLYITRDNGSTWQLFGEDPDGVSPMNVNVPGEGTYGFTTVISTPARPAAAPRPGSRPDRFVIVDRTPPTLRWLSPAAGQAAVAGDGSLALAWEASDPHMGSDPVTIEYSVDGGASWLPVREKLPAKGSINWNPPASAGESEIILRLAAIDLAGNKAYLRNKTQFSLDRDAPQVAITGPASATSFDFPIEYSATDAQSGVASVEFYYSTNNGADWYFAGQDADLASPMPVSLQTPPARQVGLYLVAADKRGNRTPLPVKGTRPMFVVDIDKDAPQVNILPPFTNRQLTIPTGSPTVISWSAADVNIKKNSAVIELSNDAGSTWRTLADNLPANGNWSWTPGLKGENLLLRVAVSDRMGNVGYGLSAAFAVDDKRPETAITVVTPTNTGGDAVVSQPINTNTGTTTAADPWKPVVADSESIPGQVDENANPVTATPAVAPVAPVESTTHEPIAIPGAPANPTTSTAGAATSGNPPAAEPGRTENVVPPSNETVIPPVGGGTDSGTPAPVGKTPEKPVATDSGLDIPPVPAAAVTGTTGNAAKAAVTAGAEDAGLSIPPIGTEAIGAIGTPAEAATGVREANLDSGQMLDQADQQYASGKYDEAEKLVRQVLAKEPKNPRAYALLSGVLTEKGRYEDAISSADHAIQLAPNETRYLQVYGYAQYSKASGIYQELAQKKVPENQIATFTGQVAQSLDASEKAYSRVLAAKDANEVKEGYYRLGQIDYFRATKLVRDKALQNTGLRKAIENYQNAFKVGNKPDYREVLQLGICYYRLEEYDNAERWLEKAQEASSENRPPKEAIFYLAMIQEKMERFKEALPLWEKVAQQYEEGSTYRTMAQNRIRDLKRQLNQQ